MSNWGDASSLFGGYAEERFALPEGINLMDWTLMMRPTIDGEPYSFLPYPMWRDIYEDEAHQIMVMAGRQVFKSTWFANMLAKLATTQKESVGIYCTYDDISLSGFSTQKYREQAINKNALIRSMCAGKKTGLPGRVGEVRWKNASVSYLVTDESQYTHVEGKSPNLICLDETQYQELENLEVVYEAMSKTAVTTGAQLRMAGIGGEQGGPLERQWNQTTQSEWKYKDRYWRNKLKFDKTGRLVVDDYLEEVLDGKWIMKNPKNRDFPGYHLPQDIFAHIPLKIIDCIKRKLPIKFSIQYKEQNYPKSRYISHVRGDFYQAQRRPITEAMIRACMEPYSYMHMINPNGMIDPKTGVLQEIVELRSVWGKQLKITLGVDFGSGKSGRSATVPEIMIKYKGRRGGDDRYQIAWVELRESENADDQAEYLTHLFKIFDCDIGVGDLGYGMDRVKKIQDGGYSLSGLYGTGRGDRYKGIGSNRFIGCRSVDREFQKLEFKDREIDESGDESQQIIIDKTAVLDDYVSFIQWRVPHPRYPEEDALRRPKLMIPYADEGKVDWLVKDMSALVRRDLEEIIDVEIADERPKARKQYNHPKDVIMSTVYNLVADQQPEPDFNVGGVFNTKGGGSPYGRGRLR